MSKELHESVATSSGGILDLGKLRLSQNFEKKLGVKKAITHVPVRRPNRQEFVRTYPDDSFHFSTAVLELKEEAEVYLVDSALWAELSGEIVAKILITTINRQGILSLWPIRLPDADGRLDSWNQSALDAAEMARNRWVRIAANRSLGAYDCFIACGDLPEPEWPDLSFQQIMNLAFRGNYIQDFSHPVIRKLRGEV